MADTVDMYEAGVKRPSYSARARRTHYVLMLMASGKHRHEIQAECAQLFQLSKPAVDTYIKKAKAEALKAATAGSEELLTAAVLDLRAIYLKAMEEGKLQVALNCRKEMNKIQGVGAVAHAPARDVTIPPGVDVERVRAALPDFVNSDAS
jgi:hypothetical protein